VKNRLKNDLRIVLIFELYNKVVYNL